MPDRPHRLRDAVKYYWTTRSSQRDQQGAKTGLRDQGSRTAVTGGKHANGFVEVLLAVLSETNLKNLEVSVREKRNRTLPGFFRPSKEWDLVATVGKELLAVVEVKSQVGSLGNNFNNRAEEALGNATDFWAAYREKTFPISKRPWLVYVFMLEESSASTRDRSELRSNRATREGFPMRPEFHTASYVKRYEILCERLVRERLYDAACLIVSTSTSGVLGEYVEPNPEIGFDNFAANLAARAIAWETYFGS